MTITFFSLYSVTLEHGLIVGFDFCTIPTERFHHPTRYHEMGLSVCVCLGVCGHMDRYKDTLWIVTPLCKHTASTHFSEQITVLASLLHWFLLLLLLLLPSSRYPTVVVCIVLQQFRVLFP